MAKTLTRRMFGKLLGAIGIGAAVVKPNELAREATATEVMIEERGAPLSTFTDFMTMDSPAISCEWDITTEPSFIVDFDTGTFSNAITFDPPRTEFVVIAGCTVKSGDVLSLDIDQDFEWVTSGNGAAYGIALEDAADGETVRVLYQGQTTWEDDDD